MQSSTSDSDALAAAELAASAGDVLMAARDGSPGADSRILQDLGDRTAQDHLASELAQRFPTDAVLSEEAEDSSDRLSAERVWIIDPLDGTREYGQPPRDDWAVHVALWQAGELTAGAVARPARGQVWDTRSGGEAPPRAERPLRLAVSRSRPPRFIHQLAETLNAELVPMGSAGVKAMAVVSGDCDAYVHAGGQYEWDSAAPVAVARAHGLFTSRTDGSPLRYNRPDPRLPDLVICHPSVSGQLLALLDKLDLPT